MANIKFSAFTQKAVQTDVDFLVGYTGADNVRITPAALGDGIYLPLGGGTMVGNTNHGDSVYSYWGASNDLQIYHDGTDSYVRNTQNSGDLIIENGGNDKDVVFRCDDSTGGLETYFFLDGSAGGALPFTVFPDNSNLTFGTGYDLRQYHNGTNSYLDNYEGDLIIRNYADDKDIQFSCDDGSGGTTLYYYLDGSIVKNRFPKNVYLEDDVKLQFGDPGTPDLDIYHDGTDSYINNNTGILNITNDDIRFKTTGAETMLRAVANGAVELMYDNSTKIATTNTGITVTDDISIGTSIIHTGDTDTKVSFGTDEIVLTTAGADAVTVKSDGDVGIGTSAPTQKTVIVGPNTSPDLSSATAADATLLLANSDPDYGIYFGIQGTGVGLIQQRRQTSATFYDLALQPYGGDVGIGTITPTERLHVSTESNTVAKFESTDGNANIRVSDTQDNAHLGTVDGKTFIGPDTSTGGNNITILSNGKVGIGDANPAYTLEAAGDAGTATDPSYIVSTAGTFAMAIGTQNSPGVAQESFVGTLSNSDFKFKANNSAVGRMTTTGKLMIGNGNVPTSSLQVIGIVEYADNAAALAAGLTAGAFYRTGDLLKVVH